MASAIFLIRSFEALILLFSEARVMLTLLLKFIITCLQCPSVSMSQPSLSRAEFAASLAVRTLKLGSILTEFDCTV